MDSPKILINKAQCLVCGDIVESRSRHDFRYCSCEAMFVDGGKEYLRRGAKNLSLVKELSEYQD